MYTWFALVRPSSRRIARRLGLCSLGHTLSLMPFTRNGISTKHIKCVHNLHGSALLAGIGRAISVLCNVSSKAHSRTCLLHNTAHFRQSPSQSHSSHVYRAGARRHCLQAKAGLAGCAKEGFNVCLQTTSYLIVPPELKMVFCGTQAFSYRQAS